MTLRLNGSTSGYVEIDAPATAGSNTLVLPTGNGTNGQVLSTNGSGTLSWSNRPILQVVSTALATPFSTSLTTDQDSGLSASITPSSSSNNVLVLVSTMLRAAASVGSNSYVYQKLWRGAIGTGALIHNGYPIIGGTQPSDIRGVGNVILLDSPSTSSTVTYRVSLNSAYAATVYMNSDTNPSMLTLMEVAA